MIKGGKITAPINIADPYNLMGVGKLVLSDGTSVYDVAHICGNTHGKINKWSFNKPVIRNTPSEITESDFFAANDGFNIPEYSNARDCANAVFAGNGDWVYNPPVAGTDWNRLTDFVGYDHNSEEWFTLTAVSGTEVDLGDTIKFSIPKDFSWLIENFAKWAFAFSNGKPISGALDVGFLLKKTDTGSVYYYKIGDWLDITDYDKQLQIVFPTTESEGVPAGTYKVVPVLTTDTRHTAGSFYFPPVDESYASTWYSIPSNPIQIKVNKAGTGDLSNISVSLVSYTVSEPDSRYYITVSSIKIKFTNSFGSDIALTNLNAKMKDARQTSQATIYNNVYTVPGTGSTLELVTSSKRYESATGLPIVTVTLNIIGTTKTYDFQLYEK